MSFVSSIQQPFAPKLARKLGYSDKDILVIVNIDDIGLHRDETEASFRALNFGMVKSGSVMVPCPNFEKVMLLWRENPSIDLGIHLTLTCEWGRKYPWSPVLPKKTVPSLYNPEGLMWPNVASVLIHADRRDIERELEAQIRAVLNSGLQPSHMDYHNDFHHYSDLLSIITGLSRKFSLVLRPPKRRKFSFPFIKNNLSSLRRRGYIFPDTQMGTYMLRGCNQSREFKAAKYHDHLRSLKPGVHVIKTHMALCTEKLRNILGEHSMAIRHIDYQVWTSAETRQLSHDLGITFIDFRPLNSLQKKQFSSL